MPEATTGRTDQQKLLDDICLIHQTPMVKTMQHVGDGKAEWSAPACVLCDELKAAGKYDAALASITAHRAKTTGGKVPVVNATAPKEPASMIPVIRSAAPAAKP